MFIFDNSHPSYRPLNLAKIDHILSAIDQFSMISFSKNGFQKSCKIKYFFSTHKFFLESMEHGGARRSSTELSGGRRCSVLLGGARRRRLRCRLLDLPHSYFEFKFCAASPSPDCRLYKASAKPNMSPRPAKRLCFLPVH